ncbi:MAG TPA: hypothetical protein VFF73_26375 [Planctomycetota bacterium]|nr:hypothetical protein [Planctomycetota bacterium]
MSNLNGMSPETVPHGLELKLDTLIAGLQSATFTTLPIRGKAVAVADLLNQSQGLVKPWKDCRTAKQSLHAAVRTKDPEAVREFLADMKTALVATLGRDNEGLATFGFKASRPQPKLTSGDLVLRTAKARQTRALNHTMGSQQKAALRVSGSAVIVNPDGTLTAPPASSGGQTKPNATNP